MIGQSYEIRKGEGESQKDGGETGGEEDKEAGTIGKKQDK
jgi:hypothetical protein